MVAIDMSLIPLKFIKINTCLWAKGPSKLSKDLGPKRCLNTWKKEESKKWGALWRWKRKVYIVRNMMAITRDNELEFQKLPENHPF
jgi:hypothetical protein